jgi:hypothetical protein
MNPNELRMLAAICRTYGKRVLEGSPGECGWEITIPQGIIANLPPGNIVQPNTPPNSGFKLRFDPILIVDGGKATFIVKEEPVESPKLEPQKEESGSLDS